VGLSSLLSNGVGQMLWPASGQNELHSSASSVQTGSPMMSSTRVTRLRGGWLNPGESALSRQSNASAQAEVRPFGFVTGL
jgi:hypothetical protein